MPASNVKVVTMASNQNANSMENSNQPNCGAHCLQGGDNHKNEKKENVFTRTVSNFGNDVLAC